VPASCARLQSRQFLAAVGDARADDGRSNMTSRRAAHFSLRLRSLSSSWLTLELKAIHFLTER
jgi:hypothetical protein